MIEMISDPVFGIPRVVKDECTGCTLCVAACPGLAITLVDLRRAGPEGSVTVPLELLEVRSGVGDQVDAVDMDGNFVVKAEVEKITKRKAYDRTLLVTLRVPKEKAPQVAGFRVQDPGLSEPIGGACPAGRTQGGHAAHLKAASRPSEAPPAGPSSPVTDETVICRCERVSAGEIRQLIRQGARDLNQLKVLRCGMGACGGKTCEALILKLFQDEGIDLCEVVRFTQRPLVAEVGLGLIAGESLEQRP
jgi:ferredoxin